MENMTLRDSEIKEDINFFYFLDNTPEKVLSAIIKNEIFTLMKIRRGKIDEQTALEILEKLHRSPESNKPGENHELRQEMEDEVRNIIPVGVNMVEQSGINEKIAAELADHGYYRLMENAPRQEELENWYRSIGLDLQGIPIRSILIFTIIKYSTRIDHGNKPNYKDIEHKKLKQYLDLHPELTNLWSVKIPDPNPPIFDLIESMN